MKGGGGGVHSADGENCGNGNLGAPVHLEVPDQEDGDDAQCPICDAGECRIGVCSVDGEFWVDTGSCPVGVLRPEVRGGTTL